MKTQKDTVYLDLFQIIGLKLKKRADESIKELGLNAQQGKMIRYIYENQENNLIQKDLADRFHLRGASITSILQGLEQKDSSSAKSRPIMSGKKYLCFTKSH